MSSEWKEVIAEWQGEMAFIGKNQAGGRVQMGEIDGQAGVSPMELLLVGLAGCTGVDVVHILKKKRAPLEDLKVRVRAKRAADYPMVYTHIEIEYLLWGQELDPKAVEQAIQLSEEKYCSASAMLGKTAQLHSSYRILAPGQAA
ncbi:MAG: OsmC family protein [Anaerolineales bacterium]|nr:OsmC family protein [Anaerolineales bacterium]